MTTPKRRSLLSFIFNGVVACLYQEGAITGIMLCHQTSGPTSGWACKREAL